MPQLRPSTQSVRFRAIWELNTFTKSHLRLLLALPGESSLNSAVTKPPVVLLFAACVCCTPSHRQIVAASKSATNIRATQPSPQSHFAHWEPIIVPPDQLSLRAVVRNHQRDVHLDAGYMRWLYDGKKAPQFARELPQDELMELAWLNDGLVATTKNGKLVVADEPLGAWRTLLNDVNAPPHLLGTYQEALILAHAGQVGVVIRLPKAGTPLDIHWLPEFEGRPIMDAKVDTTGKGLVLFSPQRLAQTSDFGRTYHELDDRGVVASKLRVDGQRVVIEPGGDHDVFARAFLPGAVKIERSQSTEKGFSPFAVVKDTSPLPPALRFSGDYRQHRVSVAAELGNGTQLAVDGDIVTFFNAPHINEATLGLPLGVALAQGAEGWGFDQPPVAPRTELGLDLDGALAHDSWDFSYSLAACEATVVVKSEGKDNIYVRRGKQPVLQIALKIPEAAKNPDSEFKEGAVLALVSSKDLLYRINETLFYVDLEHPEAPPQVVAVGLTRGEALITACGKGFPAIVHLTEWGQVVGSVVVDPHAKLPSTMTLRSQDQLFGSLPLLATLEDGSYLSWSAGNRRLIRTHSDGTETLVTLPGPAPESVQLAPGATVFKYETTRSYPYRPLPAGLGFNQQGKGLYLEPETGRVWQTLDAGKSWTRSNGLGRTLDHKRVFCTENRCEVENELVRVGWDEPSIQGRLPSPAAVSLLPKLRIRCATVKSVTLPAGLSENSVMPPSARLESSDWIAGVMESKQRPGSNEYPSPLDYITDNRTGFVVERQHKIQYYPIHSWQGPEQVSGVMVFANQHLGGILSYAQHTTPHFMQGSKLPTETWIFPDAPDQAPEALEITAGEFDYPTAGFSIARQNILARDADTLVDMHDRRLFWLDRHSKVETRSWAGGDINGSSTRPVAERTNDGIIWVARQEPGKLELLAIDPDGYTRDAHLAIAKCREVGAGLMREKDRMFVILPVERGANRQLWRFPIDVNLRVGPGEPLGQSVRDNHGLLAFPRCGNSDGEAAYLELAIPNVPVELGGESNRGLLRRLLRIEHNRACQLASEFIVESDPDVAPDIQVKLKILWQANGTDALVWQHGRGLGKGACGIEN